MNENLNDGSDSILDNYKNSEWDGSIEVEAWGIPKNLTPTTKLMTEIAKASPYQDPYEANNRVLDDFTDMYSYITVGDNVSEKGKRLAHCTMVVGQGNGMAEDGEFVKVDNSGDKRKIKAGVFVHRAVNDMRKQTFDDYEKVAQENIQQAQAYAESLNACSNKYLLGLHASEEHYQDQYQQKTETVEIVLKKMERLHEMTTKQKGSDESWHNFSMTNSSERIKSLKATLSSLDDDVKENCIKIEPEFTKKNYPSSEHSLDYEMSGIIVVVLFWSISILILKRIFRN